jgi:hypothetical protein
MKSQSCPASAVFAQAMQLVMDMCCGGATWERLRSCHISPFVARGVAKKTLNIYGKSCEKVMKVRQTCLRRSLPRVRQRAESESYR